MNILKAKDITIKYKNKHIIQDLSFEINRGRIYSIIGPNGSGKTTLLKSLTRNVKISSGKVYLNGSDIFGMKYSDIAKQMAVVTQNHTCPKELTVKDLIFYGRFSHRKWWENSKSEDDTIVDWAMEMTKLKSYEYRKMETLSGGEMQRAWIAMALAQKPQIMLLDEPTTYLDICHQIELLELINCLNKKENITVLMVLHDINQAAQYSDYIFVLKNGELYAEGKPEHVINKTIMKDVFNIDVHIDMSDKSSVPFLRPLRKVEKAVI